MLLQKVDHPSRVHLHIEADDVEREVARLEKLQKRIEQVKTWWVMGPPTGHRFCVIQPQHERPPETPTAGLRTITQVVGKPESVAVPLPAH